MITFLNKESLAHARTRLTALALTSLVALTGSVYTSAEATELKTYDNCNMYYAIDGNNMYRCYYEAESTTAKFTITDENFNTVKTIVIPDIAKDGKYISTLYTREIDYLRFAATRGLFTNDGKWCVFVFSSTQAWVYNEDGKEILELPDPEGGEESYIMLSNILSGKPYYYTVDFGRYVEDYTIWTFTGDSNTGVTAQIAGKTSAYPNPLPAGTPLTINLPKEADSHTIITITDMNGRQVMRRNIDKLATEIRISSRFSHGAYIYTVIYADGTTFSGKVAAE